MSDLLDKAHADVALDLLRANPLLTVYDGVVPNPTLSPLEPVDVAPTPYVLVYTIVGRPKDGMANALDGRSGTYVVRWYCHCVAASPAGARAVAMQVRSALLDVRPVIAGRSCEMISQDDSLAPTRDESTGRVIFDAVGVYRLQTAP